MRVDGGVGNFEHQRHQPGDQAAERGDGIARGHLLLADTRPEFGQLVQPQQHPGHQVQQFGVAEGGMFQLRLERRPQRLLDRLRFRRQFQPEVDETLAGGSEVNARRTPLCLEVVYQVADQGDELRNRGQALQFLDLQPLGDQDDVFRGQFHGGLGAD